MTPRDFDRFACRLFDQLRVIDDDDVDGGEIMIIRAALIEAFNLGLETAAVISENDTEYGAAMLAGVMRAKKLTREDRPA